jgi:hypothetical protein
MHSIQKLSLAALRLKREKLDRGGGENRRVTEAISHDDVASPILRSQ